jgi:hypothetical protein
MEKSYSVFGGDTKSGGGSTLKTQFFSPLSTAMITQTTEIITRGDQKGSNLGLPV